MFEYGARFIEVVDEGAIWSSTTKWSSGPHSSSWVSLLCSSTAI